jgi:hypothetical protein
MVSMLGENEGTELVLTRMAKTRNNSEFLATLNKASLCFSKYILANEIGFGEGFALPKLLP